VRSNDGVFVFVTCGDELVEKAKEFVYLHSGKVCVVCGVFYFKCINVFTFSCHNIWKGVEAGVAYWDANGVVPFFLQEFNQDSFAIESSFTPTPKFDSVNFSSQRFLLFNACI